MTVLPKTVKLVEDDEFFTVDFTDRLTLTEGVVSIASVTATPAGLTLGQQVIDSDLPAKKIQVRISGGTVGVTYTIRVQISTSDGNVKVGVAKLEVTSE